MRIFFITILMLAGFARAEESFRCKRHNQRLSNKLGFGDRSRDPSCETLGAPMAPSVPEHETEEIK